MFKKVRNNLGPAFEWTQKLHVQTNLPSFFPFTSNLKSFPAIRLSTHISSQQHLSWGVLERSTAMPFDFPRGYLVRRSYGTPLLIYNKFLSTLLWFFRLWSSEVNLNVIPTFHFSLHVSQDNPILFFTLISYSLKSGYTLRYLTTVSNCFIH